MFGDPFNKKWNLLVKQRRLSLRIYRKIKSNNVGVNIRQFNFNWLYFVRTCVRGQNEPETKFHVNAPYTPFNNTLSLIMRTIRICIYIIAMETQ